MGELVIVQTLVEFIRSDQSWCPRRRICINETINKLSDINRKRDQTVRTVRGQTSLGDWKGVKTLNMNGPRANGLEGLTD